MKSKKQKREEAQARQQKYDSLTLEQKRNLIFNRPGYSLRESERIERK